MTCDTWHGTHDMWHVACDTWYVIFDTWHMTHRGWQTLCQNFRSLALTVWELWCFKDWEEKGDSLNELINQLNNYDSVCWTAPATPGLLITGPFVSEYVCIWKLDRGVPLLTDPTLTNSIPVKIDIFSYPQLYVTLNFKWMNFFSFIYLVLITCKSFDTIEEDQFVCHIKTNN